MGLCGDDKAMSFKFLNISLILGFLSMVFLICACFGGSSRNSVIENASWMDIKMDAGNCKVSEYYGIEGVYSDVYYNINGVVVKSTQMEPFSQMASETDAYGTQAAAKECLNYADTTMGMCVMALFCSINVFFILLLMRVSESVRRNTFNFKYVVIVNCLLSALFISGGLGFFYQNCANDLRTAAYKAISGTYAACTNMTKTTKAGPGSVLAILGLCFNILIPVVLCPQESDPEPMAETDSSKA